MSDCCTPSGYRWVFSERSAAAQARRFRRKGLDAVSGRVFEAARRHGVEDASVLEVGGGVGGIQVELLRAGARQAVSVELTPTYEAAAGELLRELHLEGRVERRLADFVEAGADVEPADVVVLNRVICCYPDMPRLAAAAAGHTRGVLVMSFPKRRWWTRALVTAANLNLRLFRRQFQVFVHPPAAIRRVVEGAGLRLLSDRPGLFWEVAAWERPA